MLTGAGEIVTARPAGPHADLFAGFPNSYGTLGYATRVRLQLEPVQPYVALRHLRFTDLDALQEALGSIIATGTFEGSTVDYLDGVTFTADESYLTLGTQTADPGPVSDYTDQQIYYRSIQRRRTDRLTVLDYLWRWDTDWFWSSRAFGAQNPIVRRIWPARWRHSAAYWKLVALDRRFGLADRLERLHGRPPLERVVQDVEIPLDHTAEFVRWFLDTVPIEPIWLCPLRSSRRWPLYPLEPAHTYVNVGFWSVVSGDPARPGATNRTIERRVAELGGHKSLYSDSYYERAEFDALYGGVEYRRLKQRYDPQARLLDLYAKAVERR